MPTTKTGPMTIVIPSGEHLDFSNPAHVELATYVLEEIQNRCWEIAEESGWHGTETLPEKMLLWHSEVTEAAEELRNGRTPGELYYSYKAGDKTIESDRVSREVVKAGVSTQVLNKPEGVGSEVADVIIRIGDDSERYGIPWIKSLFEKLAYNSTRLHRHGGKKF